MVFIVLGVNTVAALAGCFTPDGQWVYEDLCLMDAARVSSSGSPRFGEGGPPSLQYPRPLSETRLGCYLL